MDEKSRPSGPRVVHVSEDDFDVYIGRPGPWGNPFFIGRDGTREDVIEKFEGWAKTWFTKQELARLDGKVLGCWCAPLACHGDVLVRLAREAAEDLDGQGY